MAVWAEPPCHSGLSREEVWRRANSVDERRRKNTRLSGTCYQRGIAAPLFLLIIQLFLLVSSFCLAYFDYTLWINPSRTLDLFLIA